MHDCRLSTASAFLLLGVLTVAWAPAQESALSISPTIDSLQARLLRNPSDLAAQRSLIDAYTLTFNPELALLEILRAESERTVAMTDPSLKGRIQLSLEQVGPALRSLQQAYLLSPSDETLILIGILDYARGDAAQGFSLLRRLKKRIPHLSVELLRLYEQFYLNGRKFVAGAVGRAIQETDPAAYASYFPLPQITILSPAQFFATEAAQTSVIWEVRHGRPIRSVTVGGDVVFERSDNAQETASETFQRSFTHLAPLREGRNDLIVRATDVFGHVKAETVVVNGLNYSRLPQWSSSTVDSLRKAVRQLRTYIPDSVLVTQYSPHVRALLIGGGQGFFDGAMFWYEFLTDPVTGVIDPGNAKLLVRERVEEQNISIVMNDWLLKGATFRSVSVLYLAGEWNVSQDRWSLKDRSGQWIDLKPYLEQLRSLATAGVILLFDGVSENRQLLESGLRQLAASSAVPVEALLFSTRSDWRSEMIRSMLSMPTGSVAGSGQLTVRGLEQSLTGVSTLAGVQGSPVFAKNPASVLQAVYLSMLSELERKLTRERAPADVRKKLLSFSQDWRRYNEVSRFLEDRLSLSDFIIRVDEYRARTEGDGGR